VLPRPLAPPSPAAADPAGSDHAHTRVPPHPPLAEREFWGGDESRRRRSAGEWIERLERWRHDPRAGVALLVVAAVVAGLVWYQLGSRSVGAAPGGGSASAPPRATGAAGPDGGGDPGASPGAPVGAGADPAPGAAAGRRGRSVTVHVAGAVVRPGVVELPSGSRVIDAVEAAGGARADADLDRLNLAALLTDGQRVAVARAGEPPPALDEGATGGPSGGAPAVGGAAGGPVNLNTATQQQLEGLPGVGPVLAQAILRERDRRGGFRRVEDLRGVRGIGEKRFADLRPLVTV